MIGQAAGDTKIGEKLVADYMRCYKWVVVFCISKEHMFLSCIQTHLWFKSELSNLIILF
jgi:hypothetical protein